MTKYEMREWVSALEVVIDNKLRKWKKEPTVEDKEVVHLRWTWEVNHVLINVFWTDKKESARFSLISPRGGFDILYHGLDDLTFNRLQDRVGNLVQTLMNPPLDVL